MPMKLDKLQQKLIRAARTRVPSDAVPYAFEQRVLARLRGRVQVADPWLAWGVGLWRAAVPCFSLMVLVTAWSCIQPDSTGTGLAARSGEELEVALVDSIDTNESVEDSW